ncbi:putative bifunctional diguanylate cyclase/phosphodiesterase [Alteromonas lipotrueiana]|uniref:putative bifunctional diguanylate cyclase/phosphodiesterase n=1 Tax=Alteromonas lipotrueiana TaxID=2803815 RepID=UPI001C464183|nr:bifunctional diguanylate cyclase/phosphodiesterase [Alteromonas lipotrueiana]
MPDNLELIKSDSNLRKRLLLGSVMLSVLVITIFCYVGYNLLLEMEKDLERQSFEEQYGDVKTLLAPIIANTTIDDGVSLVPRDLSILAEDILIIEFDQKELYRDPRLAPQTFLQPLKQTGFFTSGDEEYYVHSDILAQSKKPLTVIWKLSDMSTISEHVISRLSVAAFLTFWLSIWSALIMSSFIARRFESANKSLEKLALVDNLTKLYNRNALLSGLDLKNKSGALMFLDLDRFRDINDALGHDMGDRILKAFALRLRQLMRSQTKLYRYRSDEFVVWFPQLNTDEVMSRAFNLLYECREPLIIGKSEFEIGCSIGVACAPEHGSDAETLVQNAENAMLRAKRMRLGIQVYNERLAHNNTVAVTLRSQLRTALQQNQFELYYQPKVSLVDGTLCGAEAIVRWNHPDEGLLSPGYFIELVEQSGIVHAFTRYTIESAVKQIKQWEDNHTPMPVAVNLSAYNLVDTAFVPFVEKVLAESGINPASLEFELTESATMVDISVSKRLISAFNALGIKTSIDDFGTGMSSFAYLRELDVHTIKLDRAFIIDITNNAKDEKIVEAMIALCHNLDIQVVAEGIEQQSQAMLLTRLGCDVGQGYFFGKPAPVADINSLFYKGKDSELSE